MVSAHEQFREPAWKSGLAATHQRQAIYEAAVATPGHHSPETIYAAVRRRIPSISLAAAYKNLRVFAEHGLLRELSPHASTPLVEGDLEPHHHLVCPRCKAVQEVEGDFINFKPLSRQAPRGFELTQPQLDVFGLCRQCSAKNLIPITGFSTDITEQSKARRS
jgi:Fur family peroxide stress response transcriptional regulator